jgi:hypothetical protein
MTTETKTRAPFLRHHRLVAWEVAGEFLLTAVESTSAHERRRLSFEGGYLTDVGEGWTQLELLLRPPGGEAASDRARVVVVGAAGDVPLAVERPLAFSGGYLNGGEQCGPWCVERNVASVRAERFGDHVHGEALRIARHASRGGGGEQRRVALEGQDLPQRLVRGDRGHPHATL